jgi:prepilin-type N-terminal cleavage/methylation domain-containing protein
LGKGRAVWKQAKGFTTIEVIIAIMILGIALLGLASVTVSVIRGNDLGKMVTTATTQARDKMEELKNIGASQSGYDNALASGSDTVDTVFTRQWSVGAVGTAAPQNDQTKMKKITVTVTWYWNIWPHTVTLNTIISRP